jgi:hypothetical protein
MIRGALVVFVLAAAAAGSAGGASPQANGGATVAGSPVSLHYATAFQRAGAGYAILLTEHPVRCSMLASLPSTNQLRQPWVLVSLFPTRDGVLGFGRLNGEIDYPVGDAYASISRGVSIVLTEGAGPYPGAVWRGRVAQAVRVIAGERFNVRARFAARWCT